MNPDHVAQALNGVWLGVGFALGSAVVSHVGRAAWRLAMWFAGDGSLDPKRPDGSTDSRWR